MTQTEESVQTRRLRHAAFVSGFALILPKSFLFANRYQPSVNSVMLSFQKSMHLCNFFQNPRRAFISMEIICPQCLTEFTVPDGVIGPKGRKMKCSQCGHVWRYAPSASTAANLPDASPRKALPNDDPPSEPTSVSDFQSAPPAFVPEEKNSAPALSETSESRAELEMFGALNKRDNEFLGIDHAELAEIFGQDPEPIPDIFMQSERAPLRRGRVGRFFSKLFLLLLILAIAAAGAYFGRNGLVRWVPDLEKFYTKLGIEVKILGLGLEIKNVKGEIVNKNTRNTYIIRANINNISDIDRSLPFLRISLLDQSKGFIQDMVAAPPVAMLSPGATIGFQALFENASPAAKHVVVTWTKPPL